MSDLQEIKTLLQQHINQSAKNNADLRVAVGKVQLTTRHIRRDQNKQEVINKDVTNKLSKLKSYSDKQTGAITAVGFLGLSGIIAFFKSLGH